MSANLFFWIFIGFIVLEFLLEYYLDALNAKHFNDTPADELQDIFDPSAYRKSQAYKYENYRFSKITSIISLIGVLVLLFIKGFGYLDLFVRQLTENSLLQSLLFFGILLIAGSLFSLPFSYYQTFVIEEKYGFNKSTKKLFFIDQVKSLLLSIVLGGIIGGIIIWLYQLSGRNFWWYAWIFVAVISLLLNMFYTSVFVPLFNKLRPLEEGELRDALQKLANSVDYNLDKIFVIDGSKRSSKANAYFSGFGPKKKVVLYDTLLQDLEPNEITAVLAHEIGHYKRKHIIYNLIISIISTGIMLFLLSLLIDNKMLAEALGATEPSFHIGVIAFGLLFTPISFITGLWSNQLSRKFEYQADCFAKQYHNAADLISGLKKLSKNNLSNLTPHPWYVKVHYSHPTLLQRIQNLSRKNCDK